MGGNAMKPQQTSLFDDPPQKQPTRTHPVAQHDSNAREMSPTSQTPVAPLTAPSEQERNAAAHAGLADYIAGRW